MTVNVKIYVRAYAVQIVSEKLCDDDSRNTLPNKLREIRLKRTIILTGNVSAKKKNSLSINYIINYTRNLSMIG